MARTTKPLTSTEIKGAKPQAKKYKLSDGGGLQLHVLPNGSKLWRLKYRFNNKEKEYAIGVYPTISLADARKHREELKSLIANDINPNELKKQKKIKTQIEENKKENTFYNVSQKWHKNYITHVSEDYHIKLGRSLQNHLYPYIKNKPIDEITRKELINIIEEINIEGKNETARRTHMLLNKIYKYAVTHELAPHNIVADIELKEIIGKKRKNHYPTFTKKTDIKGLLNAIDDYTGEYSSTMALKILPYVFARSYNIRHMEWSEIDFNTKEWTIPAHKMKTKEEFVLPLPQQVITLLKKVEKNKLSDLYVFPSTIRKNKALSDNTLISALRRMGYTKEQFVPHSFRAMFSTIAYENATEHKQMSEVIEACLSHKETNKVKEAYNRATYKENMKELVQWYADYLDGVKNED